jgi:AmmeMemoRadiSam system protein B/AmmeMemoRadiSam system protein A
VVSERRVTMTWPALLLTMSLVAACATSPPRTATLTPSANASPTPTAAAAAVRPPAVDGAFYPDDPAELQAMVDGFLSQSRQLPQEPLVLIAPHAGYVYSGAVAGTAFRQLQGREYDAIVVLGTNHYTAGLEKMAIWPSGAYSTPLGLMPIDSQLAQAIIEAAPDHFVVDRKAQLPEHSIEVELPFLLRTVGPVPFVPILVSQPTLEGCKLLADVLASALEGRRALIVVSTDMSHYPNYQDAVQVDASTLLAIASLDPEAVIRNTRIWMARGVDNLFCTLCGEGPTLAAMTAARRMGATRTTILQYANSGDVPHGDENQVVGYGAVMFWRGETAILDQGQQQWLLQLARETLEQYLDTGTVPMYTREEPALLQPSGAFVTLKKRGQLRGCIGNMHANLELCNTVREMAVAAATKDRRFEPVSAEELSELTIEISVLSPFEYLGDPTEVQVGRDGLYASWGPYSGVLLPQVATEQGWGRKEFLNQVCLKASLPQDAWQQGAILYRFQAQVFSEEE